MYMILKCCLCSLIGYIQYTSNKGNGLIAITDVVCEGTELRLLDCLHNSNTSDCGYNQDIETVCCKYNV